MRKTFEQYYVPSETEFNRLWAEAWFAFDANALLAFYRKSAPFIDEALKIVGAIKSRLWLPYQVGLEYNDNLPGVEAQLLAVPEGTRTAINTAVARMQQEISALRHPYLSELVLTEIERFARSAKRVVDRKQVSNNATLRSRIKSVRSALDELFSNIGPAYDEQKLQAIYSEGEGRYKKSVPPGYKDIPKDATPASRYGDLVLWNQMLDQAKATARPIIFITNDSKEDWWARHSGNTRPHPLLRAEMMSETGQDYYSYTIEKFVEFGAPFFLQREPEPGAAADAKVSERAEAASGSMMSEALANILVNHSQIDALRDALEPRGAYAQAVANLNTDGASIRALRDVLEPRRVYGQALASMNPESASIRTLRDALEPRGLYGQALASINLENARLKAFHEALESSGLNVESARISALNETLESSGLNVESARISALNEALKLSNPDADGAK